MTNNDNSNPVTQENHQGQL